jgi:hypothetical protein
MRCDTGSTPYPNADSSYFLKRSDFRVSSLTRPAADFFSYAQRVLGGPNALTTTLVGSGLGALGGYGVGTVLDHVLPASLQTIVPRPASGPGSDEDSPHPYIAKSHWASTLGLMGGAAGAVPGLLRGSAAVSSGHSPLSAFPWRKEAEEDDLRGTGAMFTPSIPVDAFNQVIWANAMPNPFGTKSVWGDNDAQMYTPPQAAAIVGGLISATGAAKQQSHVSPWDVAQVAARAAISGGQGALAGAATGFLTGKVLGTLAGLTPAGQQYVQRTGLWAGLVSGIADKLF